MKRGDDTLELPLNTTPTKLKRDPGCTRCRLHGTAEHVCLLGKGPMPAKIMVIGEAPGQREEESGKPFVGKAGAVLDRLLEDVGLSREHIYITNAVHCRPPDNRKPSKAEIRACRHWLELEIAAVNPKFVLLLGATALKATLPDQEGGIMQLRGRPIKKDGRIFLPTIHPNFILHDPTKEPMLLNDLQSFVSIVRYGKIPEQEGLDIHVIDDEDDLDEALADLREQFTVSHDLETSGLSPWHGEIRQELEGESYVDVDVPPHIVCWGVGTAKKQYVFPFQHPESWLFNQPEKQKHVAQKIAKALKRCEIVAHNGKFESLWLKVLWDIDILTDWDTMLASHVLDENSPNGLKHLATVHFNAPNYDIDANKKRGDGPLANIAKYNAHDVFYTRKLRFVQAREMKKDFQLWRYFKHLTMPAARLFVDVEYNGVYVDETKLDQAHDFFKQERDRALAKLDRICPTDRTYKDKKAGKVRRGYNWGSPKQVAEVLFDRLGLDPLDKTGSGENSTSESVLLRLSEQHEVPSLILKYRAAEKNLNGFIESWRNALVDSRLHPSFKLHGTVTGRLSCENPNLQQVPRDPRIRSLLTAPPGWTPVEADLSQIELRIAAELAGEREMIRCFNTGIDVHWRTVMQTIMRDPDSDLADEACKTATTLLKRGVIKMFAGKKRLTLSDALDILTKAGPEAAEAVNKDWKETRKKAKAINFGYLYGMWWKKFVIYARDNYGVTVSDQEAEASRNDFFSLYSGFEPWHKRQKKFARHNGYVRSMFGRKRRLPNAQLYARTKQDEMLASEAQRQGINSPVQSTASDLNLAAAIELREKFGRDVLRIVGTVHDAILFWVRNGHINRVIPEIKRTMENPRLLKVFDIKFSVPIIAEVSIGPWGAGKKWHGEKLKETANDNGKQKKAA